MSRAPEAVPKEPESGLNAEEIQRQRDGILKALQAERQKRKELEDAAAQKEQDAYSGYDVDETARLDKLKNELRNEQRLFATQMSEQMARSVYPDYDEKFQVFSEAVNKAPELLDSVMQSAMASSSAQ